MAHKAACHTLSKALFEINKDMIQILLMLEELVTQNSKVEDLSVVLLPALKSDCLQQLSFQLGV